MNRQTYTILTGFAAVCILFGLLIWRLYDLQFVKADTFELSSRRQQKAIIPEPAQRGFIVDARGRLLAASNVSYTVFAEPRRFENTEAIKIAALQLHDLLQVPGHEICRLIDSASNPGYAPLLSDVDILTRDAVVQAGIPGISIETRWKRRYLAGRLTSHVVGFIGTEQTGLAG